MAIHATKWGKLGRNAVSLIRCSNGALKTLHSLDCCVRINHQPDGLLNTCSDVQS